MDKIENFQCRSADVVIRDEVAVISFLTAIDGQPNVAVSMQVSVLERLQTRIARALADRPKEPDPDETA